MELGLVEARDWWRRRMRLTSDYDREERGSQDSILTMPSAASPKSRWWVIVIGHQWSFLRPLWARWLPSLSRQSQTEWGEGIWLWLNPYRPSDDELEIQFENYGKKVSYFSGTVKLHIETTQFLNPFVPVFTCTINVYQMKIRQSGRMIMNWTPLLISLQNTNNTLDIFFFISWSWSQTAQPAKNYVIAHVSSVSSGSGNELQLYVLGHCTYGARVSSFCLHFLIQETEKTYNYS